MVGYADVELFNVEFGFLNVEFRIRNSQLVNSKCAKRTILALASGKADNKTQNSQIKTRQ